MTSHYKKIGYLAAICFFPIFLLGADVLFGLLFRLQLVASPPSKVTEADPMYTANAEIEETLWLPNFILPSGGVRSNGSAGIRGKGSAEIVALRESTNKLYSFPSPWMFLEDESGISRGKANYRGTLVTTDFQTAENLVNRHVVSLDANGWRISEIMRARTNADRHLWAAGCSHIFGFVSPEETIPVALVAENPRWVSHNLGIPAVGPIENYFAQIKYPPAIDSRGKKGLGIFFFGGFQFERSPPRPPGP
jgi:hypothetical protein